jgi:mono/diheme cytochrome c family protein
MSGVARRMRPAWRGRALRLLLGLAGGIVLLAVAALILVEWRSRRRFDAPYPTLAASTDPAVVARGEYLVYGPAACAYCHVPREQWGSLDQGNHLALTGNHRFPLPFGEIYSANITPDVVTGIGRRSDAELARILRYGVRADGRAAIPLMEYQLSDEDLIAVLSYLRSRPAVARTVPAHQLSALGKVLMAFAIAPEPLASEPPRATTRGASVERGKYLANSVSSCAVCHTNRGEDGALFGAPFGGGQRMDVAADASRVYVTPNLTPDPATSPIGQWDETTFVERFRMGELVDGTPMPWGAFGRMTDDDLRAIYRYLRSLPPTPNSTGAAVQPREK